MDVRRENDSSGWHDEQLMMQTFWDTPSAQKTSKQQQVEAWIVPRGGITLYVDACTTNDTHTQRKTCVDVWYDTDNTNLRYITPHHATPHHIAPHHITSHGIALHYITLHYMTLHCIALHYRQTCIRTWYSIHLSIYLPIYLSNYLTIQLSNYLTI